MRSRRAAGRRSPTRSSPTTPSTSIFGGDEFADLRAAGAKVQRCLWASTSTKNPDYRDVLYVEELIGPDTVDTMPLETIEAFLDHGNVERRLDGAIDDARQALREIEASGISMQQRHRRADRGGRRVASPRASMSSSSRSSPSARSWRRHDRASTPRDAARLEAWTADRVAERLWAKDGSLWAASGKPADEVAAWLGWLDLPDAMYARVDELEHLARDVREDGYRRAAVLGMGGSSLAPELFGRVFGWAGGPAGSGAASADGLELRILDSTHPDVVRGFRSWAGEQRTLFCVSSKSGSTTEPNAYQAAMGEIAPALDFLAITDPGTSLGELARAQEFRAIVEAPPDVGGRYSALTVFGLVPAALAGVDVRSRCSIVRAAWRTSAVEPTRADNPGLRLGALIGEAALAGRDKLTHPDLGRAWRPSATGRSSSSRRAPARRRWGSCRSWGSRSASRIGLRG